MLKRLISRRGFIAAGSGAFVAACSQQIKLAEPPTLYSVGATFPAEDVAPAQRSVATVIYYVTDREPVYEAAQLVGYNDQRSSSMVFGAARVRFGNIAHWDDLVARSETASNRRQVMAAESHQEIVRFPDTPLPFVHTSGNRVLPDPAAFQNASRDARRFQQRSGDFRAWFQQRNAGRADHNRKSEALAAHCGADQTQQRSLR